MCIQILRKVLLSKKGKELNEFSMYHVKSKGCCIPCLQRLPFSIVLTSLKIIVEYNPLTLPLGK